PVPLLLAAPEVAGLVRPGQRLRLLDTRQAEQPDAVLPGGDQQDVAREGEVPPPPALASFLVEVDGNVQIPHGQQPRPVGQLGVHAADAVAASPGRTARRSRPTPACPDGLNLPKALFHSCRLAANTA